MTQKRVEEKYAISEAIPDPVKSGQEYPVKQAPKKKQNNNPDIRLPPGGGYAYSDSGNEGDEEGEEEDGEEEDDEDFEEDGDDSAEADGTEEMSAEKLPKPPRDRPRQPDPVNYVRAARPDDEDEGDIVMKRVKPRRVQIEDEEEPPRNGTDDNDSLEEFIN